MNFKWLVTLFLASVLAAAETHAKHNKKHHKGKHHGKHHHGKHHHHHHHKHHEPEDKAAVETVSVHEPKSSGNAPKLTGNAPKPPPAMNASKTSHANHAKAKMAAPSKSTGVVKEDTILSKMKALEERLSKKRVLKQGELLVNGPLPANFKELFVQAAALATNSDKTQIKLDNTKATQDKSVMKVSFTASPHVVKEIEAEASDPDSKLASGKLHSFLVSKSGVEDEKEESEPAEETQRPKLQPVAMAKEDGIDIDTAMPYGDLEPFGREDTAQELTEDSIQESNQMVDQLEKAEVAEEKRAVFRALTRLRGAAITSFDGVARSQTGNIDQYNKINKWRNSHPLHHLADEESDVRKWAFPDNADF